MQLRAFRDQFLARPIERDFGTAIDPFLALRRSPVLGVAQHLPNDRMIIDRVGLVAGTKVEDFPVSSLPRATAAEDFAALKPGDEDNFIRRRNGERLAIHLGIFNLETFIDAAGDRMPGIANPESLTLRRFPPGEGSGRAHEALEDFRVMRGMEGNEAHPLPDPLEDALHHRVAHLSV